MVEENKIEEFLFLHPVGLPSLMLGSRFSLIVWSLNRCNWRLSLSLGTDILRLTYWDCSQTSWLNFTWKLNLEIKSHPDSLLCHYQTWVKFLDTVSVTVWLLKSDFKLSFTGYPTRNTDVTFSARSACQHCCTSSAHPSLMLSGAMADFCTTIKYCCGTKGKMGVQHVGCSLVFQSPYYSNQCRKLQNALTYNS